MIWIVSVGILSGQTDITEISSLESLPIWEADEEIFSSYKPDTLITITPQKIPKLLNKDRKFGLGLMLVAAVLSAYFHNKANQTFGEYEDSGDLNEMDSLFDKAENFDQLSGLSYAGVELGFLIFAYSFLDHK